MGILRLQYKGEERKARKWETYLQTYLKARLIMFQCHFKSFYAHFDDCQDNITNHNYLGREKCIFTFIISPNDESGVQIRHGAIHTSIQCPDKEQKKCVLSGWFLAFGNNKYTTIEGFIYFFFICKRNIIMSYMKVILSVSQKKIFRAAET